MSEIRPTSGEEIDLFEILETLWNGKWKIIAASFIAALIGAGFSITQPNSFEVSTPIHHGNQTVFLKYIPLNDLVSNYEGALKIDSTSAFNSFVSEFNDYEEMSEAVISSEFVQNVAKDLAEFEKQKIYVELAKSFKIKPPSKTEKNWILFFEWHDKSEGLRLLNDAIEKTLINVQHSSKTNAFEMAKALDMKNSLQIDVLRNQASLILELERDRVAKNLQFLAEQSKIAKELGIERDGLGEDTSSQSLQNGISLSVNSVDVPYYLRGYKAIDKEIALIKDRTNEQAGLNSREYMQLKEKIGFLERDLSSVQIRTASTVIENDNPKNWIEYDLALADVKSLNKSRLYMALSTFMGGLVGALYVFILNLARKRKENSLAS